MRMTAVTAVVVTATFGAALFGGCECYALKRDPNAEAEERLADELRRRYAPPIPLSRAVGCDICPFDCQHLDLSESIPMPELMARFRDMANAGWRDPETSDRLLRLACIAGRQGPEAELEFLALLRDPSEPVRYYAAFHALNLAFAIKEPVLVLYTISHTSKENYALNAWARVELWRDVSDGKAPALPHRAKRQQRPHVR